MKAESQKDNSPGQSESASAALGKTSPHIFSLSSCPSLAGAGEGGRRPDEGRRVKNKFQRGEGRGEESEWY